MAHTSAAGPLSLRWDHFSSNLTSGFLSHLSDNDLVDVTLAVEGKLFQAHKLVLSVCSPYFKDIFKVNPCQHPVVILKDMGYTEVGSLLKFMYQGEVNVRQDDLAAFLKVAEILQIKGLTGEGAKCEPHDHNSLSGDRSDLPPPLENIEADGRLNEELTQNCSEPNLPSNRTEVADKAKSKRLPEVTVSNSPTNKRCRTSPPPLEEMDNPTIILETVTTKTEPPDFDLHDDDFTLALEPLDDSSIPRHVLTQDVVNHLKDDQNAHANQQQKKSGKCHPQLHLGGYIYHRNIKTGDKTYWRCRFHKNKQCTARSVTEDDIIIKNTGSHNHDPETREDNINTYYFT